jgi:hypothetical protein
MNVISMASDYQIFIQDEGFQKLINSKSKTFDVIISSAFVCDCVFGISYILDAYQPVTLLSVPVQTITA